MTITFHSAIRYLRDRNQRNPLIGDKKKIPFIDLAMAHASIAVDKRPKLVIGIVVIVTLAALYGAININTEFGVEALLPDNWSTMQASDAIRENFDGGSFSQTHILVEGDIASKNMMI